jgi:23S rRNA pseudouridine1911/1915/1917 synthase
MIGAEAMEVVLDDEQHLDDLRAAFRVEVDGRRLDVVVAERLAVPVLEVRRLGAEGRIRVDGRAVLGGFPRLAVGARVAVLGAAARPERLAEAIPLTVLHDDAEVLIVDKPACMAVTPGLGHPAGTLANALRGLGVPLSSVEGPLRPGIVHRLDWGTSGAIGVAKDDAAHRRLVSAFLAHAALRRYVALVHGAPTFAELVVDAPLARARAGRKAQAVRPDGRPARTRLFVRAVFGDFSLVEAEPETGRTHQIRAHLAAVGHPLLGDTLYAGGDAARRRLWARLGVRRPMLHAERLEVLGRVGVAAWPADFLAVAGARDYGETRKLDGST